MAPDLSDIMTEIHNLWKEVRANSNQITRAVARLAGNGDDTGTIVGRLRTVEQKVDALVELKQQIEIISNRKTSVFLRLKDLAIIVGIIVSIVVGLKGSSII